MDVVYGPPLAAVDGKRTATEVEGDTVADVLDAFVETYPVSADQLYAEDGDLRPSVRMMPDGEPIQLADPRPDGGELALFPAMRGG